MEHSVGITLDRLVLIVDALERCAFRSSVCPFAAIDRCACQDFEATSIELLSLEISLDILYRRKPLAMYTYSRHPSFFETVACDSCPTREEAERNERYKKGHRKTVKFYSLGHLS